MIGQLPRRAVAIGLVAAAGTGGIALAQSPASSGNFGGGAIAVPVDENSVAGDMLLSIRALASGKVGVDGQLSTNCGHATITGTATRAADGSFTLAGNATRKPVLGVRERTTFTVTGVLTAEGGTGSAKGSMRVTGPNRSAKTCTSKTVSWTVRRPGAVVAPAPAPAAATLFGLTAQRGANGKRPVVLHTANAGRSIDRFVLGFRATCERGRIVVVDDVNYSPEFDVAADGSFRSVERFRINYSDVIQRTTIVVRGQFDVAGAVAGKLSVTQRYTSRKRGTRVDVCATGTLSWSARP